LIVFFESTGAFLTPFAIPLHLTVERISSLVLLLGEIDSVPALSLLFLSHGAFFWSRVVAIPVHVPASTHFYLPKPVNIPPLYSPSPSLSRILLPLSLFVYTRVLVY